jgi:exosome complex component RRP46
MINASTLALLNAGSVPMRGVVCAVSVGRLGPAPNLTLVVDPTDDETTSLAGGGCFAFLFANGLGSGDSECVWANWKTVKGTFDEKELLSARELARGAARQVCAAIRESVDGMGTALPGLGSNQIAEVSHFREKLFGGVRVRDENGEDDDAKMEI